MGQRLSNAASMLSTSCGGLGGAVDDNVLPGTGTAAAGVTLEEEERSNHHYLAWGGSLKEEPPHCQREMSPHYPPLLLHVHLRNVPAAWSEQGWEKGTSGSGGVSL